MLDAIRHRLRVAQFNFVARGITNSSPVYTDSSRALILVSQLRHRDVLMYLLALKTFTTYLVPGRIIVLDDGSLNANDRDCLTRQIPAVEICPITAVDTGPCPRGGTWERLLYILDLSQHAYVIQLDADTLTLADIPEIHRCVAENRSFTLGTPSGREFVSFDQASEFIRSHSTTGQHVQVLAERAFGNAPNKERLRYVRGNSGFAGFARGAHARVDVENFSHVMTELLGASKWREWGSEQVSSNFAIANSANAVVLPQPRYSFFNPELDYKQAAFLHFIGTHRYHGGIYTNLARAAAARLQRTLS